MARPVTIFTGQWADLGLEEMCRTAKDMGYDGLEIASWGQIDLQKAAEDPEYVKNLKSTLEKYGLGCWAIGAHLPGQCVGDVWDPRLDGFAPPELAGKPEEIRAWGHTAVKIRCHGREGHGSQGGDRLHGFTYLEDVVFIPPDHRGNGRGGI